MSDILIDLYIIVIASRVPPRPFEAWMPGGLGVRRLGELNDYKVGWSEEWKLEGLEIMSWSPEIDPRRLQNPSRRLQNRPRRLENRPRRLQNHLLEALGRLLEPLGRVLGAPRGLLGVFLALPEGSRGLLKRSWELLEASWEALGTILGSFWLCFGGMLELGRHLRSDLMTFRTTNKNLVKYKVF